MLYREIIAVCSQIHTKHTNTLCWQYVEFVSVKPAGPHTQHPIYMVLFHIVMQAFHVGIMQKCLTLGWTQTKACSSNFVVMFDRTWQQR